jgi:hypothetical protein
MCLQCFYDVILCTELELFSDERDIYWEFLFWLTSNKVLAIQFADDISSWKIFHRNMFDGTLMILYCCTRKNLGEIWNHAYCICVNYPVEIQGPWVH